MLFYKMFKSCPDLYLVEISGIAFRLQREMSLKIAEGCLRAKINQQTACKIHRFIKFF